MKFLLMSTVLIWSLALQASQESCHTSSIFGKDEGFPWPWSYQCEFDWEDVKGEWIFSDTTPIERQYTMEVYNMARSGENFLLVVQYDSDGKVVSRGLGLPSQHQRGIMVPMQWTHETDGISGYWLHLSYVVERGHDASVSESLCTSGKDAKLAVKITAFGKNQDERPPKILEKMPSKSP